LHVSCSAGLPNPLDPIVTIDVTEKVTRTRWTHRGYFVTALPSDWGRAFRLEPFATQRRPDQPDAYHVLLAGEQSTCECMGFMAHGHCLHLAALQSLQERNGQLKSA
jgi:hypothetical protein